ISSSLAAVPLDSLSHNTCLLVLFCNPISISSTIGYEVRIKYCVVLIPIHIVIYVVYSRIASWYYVSTPQYHTHIKEAAVTNVAGVLGVHNGPVLDLYHAVNMVYSSFVSKA